ncbi:hypothetical protein [Nevskia sp.]|uniref:hypothetical protein n=1 Tax=Nevskia sp. TaxID=1929292 RepID=UPI0025FC5145|nr:hypothetical protein [Nevskia sp.]
MTARTRSEYLDLIRNSISEYPDAALRYQAGDQRLLASLGAIASMCAALSQQIEVSSAEPFEKVRDATILADAALKGILPMAVPATVRVLIRNNSAAPFTLQAGRAMLDSAGNLYFALTPVTVAVGGTGVAVLQQRSTRTQTYTVAQSVPFLAIEIAAPADDRLICGISVRRSDGQVFIYTPEFCNVGIGDFIYHVESDELRRLSVRFGYDGIVGYQPAVGDQFIIEIGECNGDVRPGIGSPFALQYTFTPQDSLITVEMDALLESGAAPMDIPTIREISKYPSIYDSSAVFRGEFDFLVRRNVPGLRFLSVWNEQREEIARGPSVDNINRLFVSFIEAQGDDRATVQARIAAVIRDADDGYSIRFVPPVDVPIAVQIEAFVSLVHDPVAVANQIRGAALNEYGIDTPAARRGSVEPQYKRLYDRVRRDVPAVADSEADLRVVITPPAGPVLPEQRRAVTAASLSVTVTPRTQQSEGWGL